MPAAVSATPEPQPYLRSVREGISYVLHDRTLRAVTLTAAVVWVFVLPFETVVLNAYLQQTGQVVAFGVILAAWAAGGIAGALGYGAHRPSRADPARVDRRVDVDRAVAGRVRARCRPSG